MIDLTEYLDDGERAVATATGETSGMPDRRIHALKRDGTPRCYRLDPGESVAPVEDQEVPYPQLCLYCFPGARRDLMGRLREDLGISPETKTKEVKAGTNG